MRRGRVAESEGRRSRGRTRQADKHLLLCGALILLTAAGKQVRGYRGLPGGAAVVQAAPAPRRLSRAPLGLRVAVVPPKQVIVEAHRSHAGSPSVTQPGDPGADLWIGAIGGLPCALLFDLRPATGGGRGSRGGRDGGTPRPSPLPPPTAPIQYPYIALAVHTVQVRVSYCVPLPPSV